MYRIIVSGELADRVLTDSVVLHSPALDKSGRIVIEPELKDALNTHGYLSFKLGPNNPLYGNLKPRRTLVMAESDANTARPWFGRVISMERGFDNLISVYCEGEMACLNDSIHRAFGFQGTPEALFRKLITNYQNSHTYGYDFTVGHVSVTDPNNNIVRQSWDADTVWGRIKSKLFGSSLGGYVIPRYDAVTGTHYLDYLALDGNDQYAHTSSQVIEYGKSLLDFTKTTDAANIVTVMFPFGARLQSGDPGYEQGEPPANGSWNGNRVTIADANNNRIYLENADGIAEWGRIVGTHIWEDVTIPANLKTKAQTWLAQQIWQSVTLELSALDLSDLDVDIEQIHVGDYVRCKSRPHDLDVLLLCTEKTTYLTELEKSSIILGPGLKTITDLQRGDAETWL